MARKQQAKPEWKSEAEKFYAKQQFDRIRRDLTKDLPTGSVVTIAIVDDPNRDGQKIPVVRSLREDTLSQMRSRQQIDDAHFAAGRLWQRYFEQSEIGSIRAIDPGKEAVDGGQLPEMLTNTQIKAFEKLNECYRRLGLGRSALLRDILGQRMSVTKAAEKRGVTSGRGITELCDIFRDSLNILAVLWGLATVA